MINSSERKLALSGWLKENNSVAYNSPLKLQKFLVFYEILSKMSGYYAEFNSLKGYKNGPVFSNVYGDYTKARKTFDREVEKIYKDNTTLVDNLIVKQANIIVQTLTEKELSDLTHKLNLWKAKETRIMSGEYQVPLNEADFNLEDENLMRTLISIYPQELIDSAFVIPMDNKFFIFSKADQEQITEAHFDTLLELAGYEDLHNPVFVEIENGRLVID